ncbi:hypothetical protein H6503_00480 [Candidatus Woesearchaeota archaeon]|nr:hypothetical protein [Candidatus Woesearchaeota archaeon]
MALHHTFNEQNFKSQCIYCGTDFSELSWNTINEGISTYKEIPKCPGCDRHITVPIGFLTSGHDAWDGKHNWLNEDGIKIEKTSHKMKNLESQIKILSETIYP